MAKTQTAPTDDPVQAEVAEFSRRERAVYELSRKRALLLREGRELPEDELRFLQSTAPPCDSRNPYTIKRHIGSYLDKLTGDQDRIVQLQTAAGTGQDRQVATEAAEAAADELAAKRPELEAAIQAAQQALATIERKAADARRAAERRTQAVASLRAEALLPPFVADRLRSIRGRHIEAFGRELTRLRSRLGIITTIGAWNPDTDGEAIRLHVESNHTLGGDSTSRLVRFFEPRHFSEDDQERYREAQRGQVRLEKSFFAGKVRVHEWRDYCDSLRQEAEAARERIAELEKLEAAAADEVQRLLSYHVPE